MLARDILNPAWDAWVKMYGPEPRRFGQYSRTSYDLDRLRKSIDSEMDEWSNGFRAREWVIDTMTFAIPSPNVLDMIAKYSPRGIVEIGAGTGYWTWCLRQMGVDVVAYDKYPPQILPKGMPQMGGNHWFESWWTDIERGVESSVKKHPDRTLLLVWPYMDDMAVNAVTAYSGTTVIFVGEDHAACANDAFFDLIDKEWAKVEDLAIPQWPGMHDECWILRRNSVFREAARQASADRRRARRKSIAAASPEASGGVGGTGAVGTTGPRPGATLSVPPAEGVPGDQGAQSKEVHGET